MPEIINEKCGICCGGEFSARITWMTVKQLTESLENWRRDHKCRKPETLVGTPAPLQLDEPLYGGIRP